MLGLGAPGPWELLIVLAIVLVIFGPAKLKGLGKGLGSTMREFRDGLSGKDGDEKVPPPAESKSSADDDGLSGKDGDEKAPSPAETKSSADD